jgi:hypothetical protein
LPINLFFGKIIPSKQKPKRENVMESILKLEVGKTYATPSICDSSYMVTATIVSRTAKRVTFQMKGESKSVTKGIFIYDGKECFYPRGQYSMCPTLRADDGVEEKVATTDPIESKVLFENGETLADLFREGAELFSQEQMDAIKMGLAEVLMDEAFKPAKPMAKIYNMADYRR